MGRSLRELKEGTQLVSCGSQPDRQGGRGRGSGCLGRKSQCSVGGRRAMLRTPETKLLCKGGGIVCGRRAVRSGDPGSLGHPDVLVQKGSEERRLWHVCGGAQTTWKVFFVATELIALRNRIIQFCVHSLREHPLFLPVLSGCREASPCDSLLGPPEASPQNGELADSLGPKEGCLCKLG